MHIAVEQFRWHKVEAGYEWTESESMSQRASRQDPKTRDSRFLIPRVTQGRMLAYNPLERNPTLFREFAALPLTTAAEAEAAFAGFADRYGPLGIGEILLRNGPILVGEPLSRWWEEAGRLRRVVKILDLVEAKNTEQLQDVIRVDQQRALLHLELEGGAEYATLADTDSYRRWLWDHAFEAPDVAERLSRFARGWLQEKVNESLNGKRDGAAVSARVLYSPERQAFGLHLVPASLLAAMWLQCARVITANTTFKACEKCGKWFELSPDARRKNTRYCSARCRVAAYRQRSLANG